jgi:hypothetical protein
MTEESAVKGQKYLIIGGTTKAATTSLFNYLADHTEVCASSMKETRFFLDREYPLSSKYRFDEGLEKYNGFYTHCSGSNKLRMEATPDYLYSRATPERIRASLPNAKMVFVLREPVSRLKSWYKFARQNNDLSDNITFDQYVASQMNSDKPDRKQYMLALEQGRYSRYLTQFFELFGNAGTLVAFYEDFVKSPELFLRDICLFACIDPDFYTNYSFRIFNRTETMKYPQLHALYKRLGLSIRKQTHSRKQIHSLFKGVKSVIEPLYHMLNVRSSGEVQINSSTIKLLGEYYKDERGALERLTGRKVPWEMNYV